MKLLLLLAMGACVPRDVLDRDGDGHLPIEVEGGDDCDDADASIHPGATEVCDGKDNDCDGGIDDGEAAPVIYYTDSDGDGYGDAASPIEACSASAGLAESGDDCDDGDASVHPGAEETWYDGVDQDCDEANDFDADGDGHESDRHGGDDCDDEDPSASPTASEGWWDLSIDNDCDGSIQDQVVLDVGVDVHRIDGPEADADFGQAMVVLPAGWAGEEEVLVVSAGKLDNYWGAFYGFPVDGLQDASTTADAGWTVPGVDQGYTYGGYLGLAMGVAGSESAPVFVASAPAADEGTGVVYGWTGPAVGSEIGAETFAINGMAIDTFAGMSIPSNLDVDGDGVFDLMLNTYWDSRIAANAGTVALFLDPSSLSGEIAYDDADAMFTTDFEASELAAAEVGDVDGDGTDDVGFTLQYDSGRLVLDLDLPLFGTHDVIDQGEAQILWSDPVGARDLDADGTPEFLAISGSLFQYAAPIRGILTGDDAIAESSFKTEGLWLKSARRDTPLWNGQRIMVSCVACDEESGWIFIDSLYYGESRTLEDSKLWAVGDRPGDLLGESDAILDFDEDGREDVVFGAPGADRAGSDSGAIYLVPGPR